MANMLWQICKVKEVENLAENALTKFNNKLEFWLKCRNYKR